jgi:hypothetical protein
MALCYETSFDLKKPTVRSPLPWSPRAICGDASIFHQRYRDYGFLTTRAGLCPRNLACDITPFVRPGKNTVRVTVSAQMDHDGLVNALYIAGAFSCGSVRDLDAGTPGRRGRCWICRECGLPFYCGTIRYDLTRALCGAQGADAGMHRGLDV